MPRYVLSLVFCMALTATAGCSRTDDGTVVIPRPLDARHLDFGPLDLRHPGQFRPTQASTTIMPAPPETFPVSPEAKTVDRRTRKPAVVKKRRSKHPAVQAPVSDTAPSGLACKPATQTGERVRVMCE